MPCGWIRSRQGRGGPRWPAAVAVVERTAVEPLHSAPAGCNNRFRKACSRVLEAIQAGSVEGKGGRGGRRVQRKERRGRSAVSPSRIFILRPVATSLMMAGVVLVGVVAFRQLPVSALPQVDYPTMTVQTFYPGAGPEVMTSAVTAPLEKQVSDRCPD